MAQVLSCEFCKISKNTFFYRTPLGEQQDALKCKTGILKINLPNVITPTNTPRGIHVETTWKRSFLRRFNVEATWCVCRLVINISVKLVLASNSNFCISRGNQPKTLTNFTAWKVSYLKLSWSVFFRIRTLFT